MRDYAKLLLLVVIAVFSTARLVEMIKTRTRIGAINQQLGGDTVLSMIRACGGSNIVSSNLCYFFEHDEYVFKTRDNPTTHDLTGGAKVVRMPVKITATNSFNGVLTLDATAVSNLFWIIIPPPQPQQPETIWMAAPEAPKEFL